MDEQEFIDAADAQLEKIEAVLDRLSDSGDVDIDVETKAGGVIEVECANGSKVIINRHVAAREIWLAAKSGGFHFHHEAGRWLGTRDSEDLMTALARVLTEQCGSPIRL